MRIFMSYRRADSADVSGRIYDRLVAHFGDEAVFKDVDDIPYGVNFREFLHDMVSQSAVELVIIGPDWLDAQDEAGRRLEDPSDWVRIEIEAALERRIPVIPVLVRGASMPPGERLPADLKELSDRHGTVVRPDPDFHRDMDRLIKGIDEHLKSAELPPPQAPAEPPEPVQARPEPRSQPTPVPTRPIPPTPAPSRKTSRGWLWAIVGLAVLIAVILVIALPGRGTTVTMPNLIGMMAPEADAVASEHGFAIEWPEPDGDCPYEFWEVVDQAPDPGTDVRQGGVVGAVTVCR